MTTPMTQAELNQARTLLNSGDLTGMYDYMASYGHNYAVLAKGVVTGETISGSAALEYMRNTAESQGRELTEGDINAIRLDMADRYLNALQIQIVTNNGVIDREIDAKEAKEFHDQVFIDNNLTPEAWTLTTIFNIAGESGSQAYWDHILQSAGNEMSEISDVLFLTQALLAYKEKATDAEAQEINDWLLKFMSTSTVIEMFQEISEGVIDHIYSEFIKALNNNSLITGDWFKELLDRYGDNFINFFYLSSNSYIDGRMNDLFRDSYYRATYGDPVWGYWYGPLVIDLDNSAVIDSYVVQSNGIDLSYVLQGNGSSFDHDGDGALTAMSWLSPNDGFLVRDVNGNGVIDNGSEMFGDYTVMNDGNTLLENNHTIGYVALRELDSNSNWLIDAGDAAFSEIMIWQDINSDGVSQSNELFTLSDLGIVEIGLSYATDGETHYDESQVAYYSHVTYVDGSTSLVADARFRTNPFFTTFTDTLPVSDTVAVLPDMNGSGMVRTLREAASMSPVLEDLLTQFTNAGSRQEQIALMDDLLLAWADTSTLPTEVMRALEVGYVSNGIESGYLLNYEFGDLNDNPIVPTDIGSIDIDGYVLQNGQLAVSADEVMLDLYTRNLSEEYSEFMTRLGILERFNGISFLRPQGFGSPLSWNTPDFVVENGQIVAFANSSYNNGTTDWMSTQFYHIKDIPIEQDEIGRLNSAYNILYDSVYQSLVIQSRLKPYFDSIEIIVDEEGDLTFDFSALNAVFENNRTIDADNALVDLAEFATMTWSQFQELGWNGVVMLENWTAGMTSDHPVYDELEDIGVSRLSGSSIFATATASTYVGTDNNNIFFGDSEANTIGGNRGDDYVLGGDGDDFVVGGEGSDWVSGGTGNDTVSGGLGDDYLFGNEDDDTLDGHEGNDYLDGGTGNDTLSGGAGNDTYFFARGYGRDEIDSYANHDPDYQYTDVLQFADDISVSDVAINRPQGAMLGLELSINGTDDVVFLDSYFNGDGEFALDEIRFSDGTVWTPQLIRQWVLEGNDTNQLIWGFSSDDIINAGAGDDDVFGRDGNDAISGGSGNDRLHGEDGNDILEGNDGNDQLNGDDGDDTLLGGEGADTIYADAGNDFIDGGRGDDTLIGGYGDDLYYFRRGDGQDTINNYDTSNGFEAIIFDAEIVPDDISVSRSSYSLVLKLDGGLDRITVSNYFQSDGINASTVEEIRFADGTVWNVDRVKALALQGTDAAETLTGYATGDYINGAGGNDIINGAAGNDYLYGGMGNDTIHAGDGNDYLIGADDNDTLNGNNGDDYLYGGAGNDTLNGGAGNDTYYFGRGDGQDTINNSDTSNGVEAIIFGADITTADVNVSRASNNLVLTLIGSTDRITVTNYFQNDGVSNYTLEEIRFADGVVWNVEMVKALALQGSDAAETLTGYATADYINGDGGNDVVFGNDGGDYLIGGEGNDRLNGGNGDDHLIGGSGNDTLNGGADNDTYYFTRGDGQDIISENQATANMDMLMIYGDISPNQLWFSRYGNSLQVSVIGSSDRMTISNWYGGVAYHVERFDALNSGLILVDSQVENLVSAMAAFGVTNPATFVPTAEQQAQLDALVAANWQAA